jgi:predicted permease
MIVLNALFPIFALLVLGAVLKRVGLTDAAFLKKADKLIYTIFFPLLLFWKIGGAEPAGDDQWLFVAASLLTFCIMFVLSTLFIIHGPVTPYEAGSFSQSCYRFNTYIGVAVVINSLGEAGIAYFGVLIGIAIPVINVFAVSLLIWFGQTAVGSTSRPRLVARALVANPLIIGCFLGIGYSRMVGSFPLFLDNTLQLAAMVTLPLALLSIGGSLSFSGLRAHLKLATVAAAFKLVLLPATAAVLYALFGLEGVARQTGLIFFCLPASTAIYVLSSQLRSDTELASAAIVISTIFSFVSLSVALLAAG